MSDDKLEIARKRAKIKMDFIRHLATYILVIAVLIIINNVTQSDYQWWIWPAIFWGTGIIGHFLRSFVFSNHLEQKLTEKELEIIDKEEE